MKTKNNTGELSTVLKEIVRNIWYWLLFVAISGGTLLFAIWLPNLSFLRHTAVSSDYTIVQKFSLFFISLGALDTNFTQLSRTLTIIVALLFATNVVLVVHYFRKKLMLQKSPGLSMLGLLIGFFGIGCAACGSVLLSSVFGIAATVSFIRLLPLGGQEFGLLSITILGFSIFLTIKKIKDPVLCKTGFQKLNNLKNVASAKNSSTRLN